MRTVTKRALNQNTAQVLEEALTHEALVVTERGTPRWRIEAIDSAADPVERLSAVGRIQPAKPNPAPWSSLTNRPYSSNEIDRLFADSRGDH